MASFFRSISTKIFGIAVGLLILMVSASAVSTVLATHVHRQLRTLSQSLFPLTVTLTELRSSLLTERVAVEERGAGPDGRARCLQLAAARTAEGDVLIARARALRDRGARIAVLERNQIKLARLEPLIDNIADEHAKLDRLLARQCNAAPNSPQAEAIDAETDEHADVLVRKVTAVTDEISAFVTEGGAIVERNQALAFRANAALIGISALVGLMLAWLVARGLTRPIVRLRVGAQAVQSGRLDEDVPVTSADEIGDVTRAFNHMVEGLRAKERIKERFGQFVDPRIVAELVQTGADKVSAGQKQLATVFFSDIAGFTSISERLSPATIVAVVNAYFSEMSGPIRDRHGIIDKYIGDGIMAFWAPPFTEAQDQPALACAAALEQFARLEDFRRRVPDLMGLRRDAPLIDMRIGLATGEVVVGSIGSDLARSFTVMGDTVNFGSRLEGANKAYGTRILIDERTHDMAGAAIAAREVDRVAVVGREEALRIFELGALAGCLSPERAELFGLYGEALVSYRKGDWAMAERKFLAALKRCPGDGPSTVMLARVGELRADPPPAWTGVWRLTSK